MADEGSWNISLSVLHLSLALVTVLSGSPVYIRFRTPLISQSRICAWRRFGKCRSIFIQTIARPHGVVNVDVVQTNNTNLLTLVLSLRCYCWKCSIRLSLLLKCLLHFGNWKSFCFSIIMQISSHWF